MAAGKALGIRDFVGEIVERCDMCFVNAGQFRGEDCRISVAAVHGHLNIEAARRRHRNLRTYKLQDSSHAGAEGHGDRFAVSARPHQLRMMLPCGSTVQRDAPLMLGRRNDQPGIRNSPQVKIDSSAKTTWPIPMLLPYTSTA